MEPLDRPPVTGLFLRTFGSPALIGPDGAALETLRRKDLALLVFLTVEQGAPHGRSRLATLLWSDSPEVAARHSLDQALGRVRRMLGAEALFTDPERVQLRQPPGSEVQQLQSLARESMATPEHMVFYREDFLTGFNPGPGAKDFEDWRDRTATRYRNQAIDLLEQWGRSAEDAGEWRLALRLAERAVEIDRACERCHRRMLRAWHALGERARALQHYQLLHAWLEEIGGGEPHPETTALVERIRSQPHPAPPPSGPAATASGTGQSTTRLAAAVPMAPTPSPSSVSSVAALGGAAPEAGPAPQPAAPVLPGGTEQAARRQRKRRLRSGIAAGMLAVLGLGGWLLRASSGGAAASGVEDAEMAEQAGRGGQLAALAAACAPGAARAALVDEVSHYGIQVRPATGVAKGWTLQNVGECSWTPAFRLHRDSVGREQLSVTNVDIPVNQPVPPGATYTFSVLMRAPEEPGTYDEFWSLRDAADHRVRVGRTGVVAARLVVPNPSPRPCAPGEISATLLTKKFIDGVLRQPGERFRFGWTIKNDGSCSWPRDMSLRFVRHTQGRLSRVPDVAATRAVGPGETYTFLVPMHTGARPGVYREEWSLHDAGGAVVPIDGVETVHLQFRIPDEGIPVSATPVCRADEVRIRFIDENWLDDTVVPAGRRFLKRWTLFNIGACAWPPDFRLRYTANRRGLLSLSQQDRLLGEVVPPWTTYTFEVPMRAPDQPGQYREDWRFTDARGSAIKVGLSPYIWAQIVVPEP